jgi:hypothetical protein
MQVGAAQANRQTEHGTGSAGSKAELSERPMRGKAGNQAFKAVKIGPICNTLASCKRGPQPVPAALCDCDVVDFHTRASLADAKTSSCALVLAHASTQEQPCTRKIVLPRARV